MDSHETEKCIDVEHYVAVGALFAFIVSAIAVWENNTVVTSTS